MDPIGYDVIYPSPPQKKWTNIDTEKRDHVFKRKWIIFHLVWFSEASCYFFGWSIWSLPSTCFVFGFPTGLYEIRMRQFLIHQFTVFFFGGGLYDTWCNCSAWLGYENDEFGPSESNFVWNMFQKSSREDPNDVSKCETKGGLPALLHFHWGMWNHFA